MNQTLNTDEQRLLGTAILEKEMRLKEQIRTASSEYNRRVFEGDLQDLLSARLRLGLDQKPTQTQ